MKSDFSIRRVTKPEAAPLLDSHHYLSGKSKGFKSGVNFGLIHKGRVVGACIYTGFPVPELAVGLFGLARADQDGLWELSRLCLDPLVQKAEHNLASWFVSRTLRLLRTAERVRAVLSYADEGHHTGVVYQAANFWYYGLSARKNDYWMKDPNGVWTKQSRGSVRGKDGEWRPRTRKHRYLIVYDPRLVVRWDRAPFPKRTEEVFS